MKKNLVLLLFVCLAQYGYAQSVKVGKWEGGFDFGIARPLGHLNRMSAQNGGAIAEIEIRRNLDGSPWDYGFFTSLTTGVYKRSAGRNNESADKNDGFVDKNNDSRQNSTLAVGIVSNYNFRQGRTVNPYAGLGLGIGLGEEIRPYIDNGPRHFLFAISPRIGVELFHHLRLGLEFQFSRKGFHTASFKLGLVLGGGSKKQEKKKD